MEARTHLPDTLEELRELERQIEREWWWLHGALNAVAQMHAERATGTLGNFRDMHTQAREVDKRRVQIAMRIAEINVRSRPTSVVVGSTVLNSRSHDGQE